ncbi:MAG TPA: hypothetical protein VFP91_17885 [Vicinamibacterales bacterium]|nr:hypothetical protein [Vicinamibacterales bacterium]
MIGAACSRGRTVVDSDTRPQPPVVVSPLPVAPAPAEPQSAASTGQAFDREARQIFRIVACAGNEPVRDDLEPTVEAHCALFRPALDSYRRYIDSAGPYLTALQPKNLPTNVVYPFGGGDLLSALTTYPNLTEVTTLSLEHAGDPRRAAASDAESLADSLRRFRSDINGLLTMSDSTTENMMDLQRGDIPGQLAFFLVALAIHDQVPVSLRFFRLEEDGSSHYLEENEIADIEDELAKLLNQRWKSPDFSAAFSNMELTFRSKNQPDAPVRVHRHIAANLMDGPLASDPRVMNYLEKHGHMTAMTKAASYTLWNPNFSRIRTYLVENMTFMISDSTGIPPQYLPPAHFAQETYGSFAGPFLDANMRDAEDFRQLWNSQVSRPLPFRYGYLDADRRPHLVVTRRVDVQ